MTSNILFYEGRAAEEDARAAASTNPKVAAAHAAFACAYRDHIAHLSERMLAMPVGEPGDRHVA